MIQLPKNTRRKYLLRFSKVIFIASDKLYKKERGIVLSILDRHKLNRDIAQYDVILNYLQNENNENSKKYTLIDVVSIIFSIIALLISFASLLNLKQYTNVQIISMILFALIIILICIGFVFQSITNVRFIYKTMTKNDVDYKLLIEIINDIKIKSYH